MPRLQTVTGYNYKSVAVAGTPERLSAVSKLVTSVLIQARSTNGGLMSIGDASFQTVQLQANACMKITGDGLDNGTTAFFDLYDIWINSTVNGESVGFMILDGY